MSGGITDEHKLLDAMNTLSSTGAAEQIRKLLEYRDAFHALVGWKVGDYAVLTRDLNGDTHGAWKGLPYLVAGSVGRVLKVDWNGYHKRPGVLWEPAIEPSTSLRATPRFSAEKPRGSVEHLYAGGATMNRDYPDEATRKAMQERIDAFTFRGLAHDGSHGGYVPFTVASPDNPHCYQLWLEDIRHAEADDVKRATDIRVQCLRCGVETDYSALPVYVYDGADKSMGGMRPARTGEDVRLPYRRCPSCKIESRGLLVLNPPWPMSPECVTGAT
jgi:hypothetical protein